MPDPGELSNSWVTDPTHNDLAGAGVKQRQINLLRHAVGPPSNSLLVKSIRIRFCPVLKEASS
jgi:hypothetical protein